MKCAALESAAWTLAFAVACAPVVLAFAGRSFPDVSSDTLTVLAEVDSLRRHGGDVAWFVAGPSYLFPDIVVVSLLRPFFDGIGAIHTAAFVVHLVTLVAATWGCLRVDDEPDGRLRLPLAAGVVAAWLASLYAAGRGAFGGGAFFPGNHQCDLAPGLAFVALAARRFERGSLPRLATALTAALVAVMLFSDPGFAMWFVVPVHATTWGLTRRGRGTWRAWRLAAAWDVVACALGMALRRALAASPHWTVPDRVLLRHPSHLAESAAAFVRDLPEVFEWAPFAALVLAAGVVLLARPRRPAPPIAPMLVAALAVTAVAPLATAHWSEIAHRRYLLPLYFLPYPLVAVCVVRSFGGAGVTLARRCALAVLASVIAPAAWASSRTPPEPFPHIGLAEELDRLNAAGGFSRGVADYWNARLVTMTSRSGVRVGVVTESMVPWLWASNADDWFDRDGTVARWPEFRFVVVDRLDRELAERRFGAPRDVVRVRWDLSYGGAQSEVWLYPSPGPPAQTDWLRADLREECHAAGLRSLDDEPPR